MKILAIGGCGHIGSALVPALLERGHDIHVADLQWFGRNLPDAVPVHRIDAAHMTVEHFEGFDTVLFLAGLSNDPMADWDPPGNYRSNAALPAQIAYLARKAGAKRMVHAGSCSVYGRADIIEVDEHRTCGARTPYGVAKAMAEVGCMAQAGNGFSVINLRQGTLAGHSPRMRFDLVINAMVRDGIREEQITVNDPDAWRPILTMRDAVRAWVKAVETPPELSGTYNVASCNSTVIDIAFEVRGALRTLLGEKKSPYIRTLHGKDIRSYRVSSRHADRELDWQPLDDIRQAALDVARHWDSYGDPMQQKYYNIDTFKGLRPEPAASRRLSQSLRKTAEIALPLSVEATAPILAAE